ncbi:MAG: N-acetylglutamate synthase, partial [Bryobacteraceae bacterium]
VGCVCLFTRLPEFFQSAGFFVVEDRAALPDKIYKDCQVCPRLHHCDEVAMARGVLPDVSILGPREPVEQLVRIAT